jgi:hypothetical protein
MKSKKKHNGKSIPCYFLSIFGHVKSCVRIRIQKKTKSATLSVQKFIDGQCKNSGLNSKNISQLQIKDGWFSIMARNGERKKNMNWNKKSSVRTCASSLPFLKNIILLRQKKLNLHLKFTLGTKSEKRARKRNDITH